jgi:hypothetical protein
MCRNSISSYLFHVTLYAYAEISQICLLHLLDKFINTTSRGFLVNESRAYYAEENIGRVCFANALTQSIVLKADACMVFLTTEDVAFGEWRIRDWARTQGLYSATSPSARRAHVSNHLMSRL